MPGFKLTLTSKAFSPMSQKGDLSLGKGNWGRVGTPQGWDRALGCPRSS